MKVLLPPMTPKQASWPDPMELLDLLDAVNARETKVILDGKLFDIRYEGDMFYVSPTEGFAPCGWFDRNTAFVEVE